MLHCLVILLVVKLWWHSPGSTNQRTGFLLIWTNESASLWSRLKYVEARQLQTMVVWFSGRFYLPRCSSWDVSNMKCWVFLTRSAEEEAGLISPASQIHFNFRRKKNKNPPRWSEEWSSLTVRLSCRQWRGKLEVMTVEKDRAGNSGDRRNYVTRKTPSNLPNVKSDIDFKKYLLRFWCWQLPCLEVNSSHSVRLDSVEWSVVMLSKYLDCRQADLYLFKTGTG